MAAIAIASSFPRGITMPPRSNQSSDDKFEILRAIGLVNESIVGLRSDVSYMRIEIDKLGRQIHAVEEQKASRLELSAAESRLTQALATTEARVLQALQEYKVQAKIDLDRVRADKLDASEFTPSNWDSILERMGSVESKVDENKAVIDKWENRAEGGWTILAKVGAVSIGVIGALAALIHEYIAFISLVKPH